MKTVFIDPPFSPSRDWKRFGFSDIIWGYTQSETVWEKANTYIVSSYRSLPYFDTVQWVTIPAYSINLRNIATQWFLYRRFAKTIVMLNPDIIVSPDYFSLAIMSQFTTRPIMVLTTPGSISERIATFNPYDRGYTLALQWAKNKLKKVPKMFVLASSQYMKEWWEKDQFTHTAVIPLPVTTSPFIFRTSAKNQQRWSESLYHLLFVGALREENNIIDAFTLIKHLNQHSGINKRFLLHVVGSGQHMLAVQQAKHDGVPLVIHGQASPENMTALYSAADALVVSRRYNAVPRVALEALCCGTPVIANLNRSLDGFGPIDSYILQENFREVRAHAIREFLNGAETLQQYISEIARAQFDSVVVQKQVHGCLKRICADSPVSAPQEADHFEW